MTQHDLDMGARARAVSGGPMFFARRARGSYTSKPWVVVNIMGAGLTRPEDAPFEVCWCELETDARIIARAMNRFHGCDEEVV